MMKIKIYSLSMILFCVLPCSTGFALQKTYHIGPKKLVCVHGDITKQSTQAIVNAANDRLKDGAGVCGAIFKSAGNKELQAACDDLDPINGKQCPTGQARITGSFKLKSKGIDYIIHAVGPDCRIVKDTIKRKNLLEGAYLNSLLIAQQNGIKSISFPFISSAIYAYPKNEAANIAIDQIIKNIEGSANSIEEVRMVLFLEEDYNLFVDLVDVHFGKKTAEKVSTKQVRASYMHVTSTLLGLGLASLLSYAGYRYYNRSENSRTSKK